MTPCPAGAIGGRVGKVKCAGVSDALSCAGVDVLGIPIVFLGSVRAGGPAPT